MVARHIEYAIEGDTPTRNKRQKTGYFDDNIKNAGAWADGAYRASTSDTDTQTELAVSAFLRESRQVEGVTSINLDVDCTTFEQTIRVVVPDLLSQSAWEISKIRSRILRDYPDAHIDIDIDEPNAQ